MAEDVIALGRAAPLMKEARVDQLADVPHEQALVLLDTRRQDVVPHYSADRGGELGRLAGARGEGVEACAEELPQRAGDGCLPAGLPGARAPCERAGVEEQMRELLHEER